MVKLKHLSKVQIKIRRTKVLINMIVYTCYSTLQTFQTLLHVTAVKE